LIRGLTVYPKLLAPCPKYAISCHCKKLADSCILQPDLGMASSIKHTAFCPEKA
jgi:hypothetical protein